MNSECFSFQVPDDFISDYWKHHRSPKRPKIGVSYTIEYKEGKLITEVFFLHAISIHHRHIIWCDSLYKQIDSAAYDHAVSLNNAILLQNHAHVFKDFLS